MIKLTWAQIRDPEFNPVLNKILRAKMPYASAKRILDLMKEIRSEQVKSDEMWATLTEKYLEPIPETSGQMMRVKESLTEEEKTEADKTLKEFGETAVEIQKQRITPDELFHVELSPVELLKLDGLLEAE
jgi:hypothetical protein